MSVPSASNALKSAIASSIASRVPEPIVGWAERWASPMRTMFSWCQRPFLTIRQRRQNDRLVMRGLPASASLKVSSIHALRPSSFISPMPDRSQVPSSTSATNVLFVGV